MLKFISHSEDETINLACKIGNKLKNGDLIVLSGNLGSGKTRFTQGILKNFGLENDISSPTFTIVNEHHTETTNIYHFDVYRLQDVDEFYAIGGEEYLANGICIIEWGEIIEEILPDDYIKVIFERDPECENNRILNFEVHGNRLQTIVEEVLGSENT